MMGLDFSTKILHFFILDPCRTGFILKKNRVLNIFMQVTHTCLADFQNLISLWQIFMHVAHICLADFHERHISLADFHARRPYLFGRFPSTSLTSV